MKHIDTISDVHTTIRTFLLSMTLQRKEDLKAELVRGLTEFCTTYFASSQGNVQPVAAWAAIDYTSGKRAGSSSRSLLTSIKLRFDSLPTGIEALRLDYVSVTIHLHYPVRSGFGALARAPLRDWLRSALAAAWRSVAVEGGARSSILPNLYAWNFGEASSGYWIRPDGSCEAAKPPGGFDELAYIDPARASRAEQKADEQEARAGKAVQTGGVQHLSAQRIGSDLIRLTWPPLEGATAYSVEWLDEDGAWRELDLLEGQELQPNAHGLLQYDDTVVSRDSNTYRICAHWGKPINPSIPSASVTVPTIE